jgi:hypothetical protein
VWLLTQLYFKFFINSCSNFRITSKFSAWATSTKFLWGPIGTKV